jgi:hypothetical protein
MPNGGLRALKRFPIARVKVSRVSLLGLTVSEFLAIIVGSTAR